MKKELLYLTIFFIQMPVYTSQGPPSCSTTEPGISPTDSDNEFIESNSFQRFIESTSKHNFDTNIRSTRECEQSETFCNKQSDSLEFSTNQSLSPIKTSASFTTQDNTDHHKNASTPNKNQKDTSTSISNKKALDTNNNQTKHTKIDFDTSTTSTASNMPQQIKFETSSNSYAHPEKKFNTYEDFLQSFKEERLYIPGQSHCYGLISIVYAKQLQTYNHDLLTVETKYLTALDQAIPTSLKTLFSLPCRSQQCTREQCDCFRQCQCVADIISNNETHDQLWRLLEQDQKFALQRKARWINIAMAQATQHNFSRGLQSAILTAESHSIRPYIDQNILQKALWKKNYLAMYENCDFF